MKVPLRHDSLHVPTGKPWPVAWCAGQLPDRTPNDVAQKPQTCDVILSSRVVVHPWRGASCWCWNDDFWLETRAIFSSYRTPWILTNEIHTLVVKIPEGTLTSCWQLPLWAPWWLSGHVVELVQVYLPWSASRLSRRVASPLAALTARKRVAAVWWTLLEKSPVQTEDKWTGTHSCWPRNADTWGQPDESAHEDRHRVYLSIPSSPDFWWLIGRTLASPSWSVELPCGGWEWTGRSQVADLLSSWQPGTTDCRILGTLRWWLSLWLPSSARHRRLAEDPVCCSWSGNWCFDGWAEVVAGMQCPPHPRWCRWPDSCPTDTASAGQSLPGEPPPGTRQRCLVEVDEVLPDFCRSWKGRGRALPAPARKGGSSVTVLWVVDGGEPSLSKTEGLGAVFLDDVTLELVLSSRCFSAKVTDEPTILSACLMAWTRFWRTFGSGPSTWSPSNGAVCTEERTWGCKLKFFRRASRPSNCRFNAAAKPADTAETWASWIMASFSRRSFVCSSLGRVLLSLMPPSSPLGRRRWRTSGPTLWCPNTPDVTYGRKKGPFCYWIHGHHEAWVRRGHHDASWDGKAPWGKFASP